MRILIPDDMIADGHLPRPEPGILLPGMGVCLAWRWTADGRDTEVEGTVEWSRFDEPDKFFETVIVAAGVRMLWRTAAKGRLPEPGQRVVARGSLHCVRPYEFEDFALPDVRRDWRVLAVESYDREGYVVDAVPVESGQTLSLSPRSS